MTGRIAVLLPRDLPARRLVDYARHAEWSGFDELWVVEDLGYRGGVAQAAAVLASTTSIRVGIGILPAAARNVAFAAMEAATLAQLYPGRIVVGVGHGMPDWMRSVGAWPASPLTLLREVTVALRALLRGETVSTAGRYVALDGVRLEETPEVVPPVVLGVRGPRSIALAGEVSDGVLLAEPSPPSYLASTVALLGAPRAPGTERFEVASYDVAAVADDGAAARALVRPGLTWIGEADWAPHLAGLPFAEELARLRADSPSREAFAAALPEEWLADLALAGTPEEVRAGLEARFAAGATTVTLLPAAGGTGDPFAALDSFARVLG